MTSCDEKFKDEDLAFLAREFKKFFKNKNIFFERYNGESSISRKNKCEKSNIRNS